MSALDELKRELANVVSKLDTAIGAIDLALIRREEAETAFGAAVEGTQDDEVLEALRLHTAAADDLVEIRRAVVKSRNRVQSYRSHVGGGEKPPENGQATSQRPAGARRANAVGVDGSEYPSEATWAAGEFPRRVRENQGDQTIGYVDGSLVEKFTSGNDGTWTPYVRERGRALGLPQKIMERLGSHVELKAAARMIQRGQQQSELVINHVPCGSQPHQGPGCHQAVERFLPKGHSLTVHGTTQQGTPYSHTYRGQA